MKKLASIAFFLVQPLFATICWAAPCVSGPHAVFPASGFSCTVGSLEFSDFTVLEQPTTSLPFPVLTLNPVVGGPNEFGLEFRVDQSASANQLFEQLIGYRVAGLGPTTIDRNTLFFTGSSTLEDAAVSALEQKCIGGEFAGSDGVSGCTGSAFDLAVVNVLGTADPPISLDFSAVAFLSVVSDIAVDGGTSGAGALTSATNLFRASAAVTPPPGSVNEPASLALCALALLLLSTVARRMR